ncbi:MAG: LamG domain-containing protein [Phycisphaerae bacterium]
MKNGLTIFAVVILTTTMAMGELVGYWPLDEGTGLTAADSSGHGKTGVLYAADSNNYPAWITGHNGSGGALQFNANTTGSSNWNHVVVDINTADGLASLGRVFTVAAWVRRDTLDYLDWPRIIDTDAYDVELALDPDGDSASWDPYDYFYSDVNTPWALSIGLENDVQKTLGSWYHLAITSNGQVVTKYVNGIAVHTTSTPLNSLPVATTDFYIASKTQGDAYFTGALDDVAVWAGKYLPVSEIAKLVDGTATPLTVVESSGTVAPVYYIETPLYVLAPNPAALNVDGIQMMSVINNQVVYNTSWIFPEPNSQLAIKPFAWFVKNETNYNNIPEGDLSKYGVEWIDSSWNGREPNMAVMAAYITPGMVYGQGNCWYEIYWPTLSWCNHAYFRTNIRVAAINAHGASVRVALYSRSADLVPDINNHSTLLTLLEEVEFPLNAGDRVWQHLEMILPKILSSSMPPVWFEMAIVGGDANTVLYIDNFRPDAQAAVTLKSSNFDKDTFINYDDVDLLGDGWLDSSGAMLLDPRSGGLLANGDFSADSLSVLIDDANKVMNPTGWTFTGTGAGGLIRTAKRGRLGWYFSQPNVSTIGGNLSAFLTDKSSGDPNVLEQTASGTVASGQTYYAMGYVMGYKYNAGNDLGEWYSWKDTATMEIVVDGVVKATASRPLSRSIWRALYCSYTAVGADAGKPIKIRFSYNNSYINVAGDPSGAMNVGYAYLGTTMPTEYPEKRTNLLTNGGFEDLSVVQTQIPTMYTSLTTSDNSGGWFISGIPALFPGWMYEVPTGYDMANKGGAFSSAYYGSPIPTPGLNDIVLYAGGTLVYGQIVGALTSGTTYYLDTACGVLIEPQTWGAVSVTWPNPVPKLHIELWRIPAGVTDPNIIHTGITTLASGYVKLANADVNSTGDIKSTTKWQIIGTSYTATSSDTNVYVRIYGTNPVVTGTTYPSFVFSDVYLSTAKRQIQGGSLVSNIAAGTQYDVLGPYNCYQAGLMGYSAPAIDINGDCLTNFVDFSVLADEWLELGFE